VARTRRSEPRDLEDLHRLIHRTIDACYPAVYPPRAVDFFKRYHSPDAIIERAAEGLVLVVEDGNVIVATGAIVAGEITGVFVATEYQGRGLGALLMDELEAAAQAHGCDVVRLSVSLPSKGFYEKRDYRLTDLLSADMGEGECLDYWEGEKSL
jgi:ribosomal protein S18 acetylase RimI-like enzyme